MATASVPLYDTMATHGPTSPAFIKPEPDDFFGSGKFNKDEQHFHQQNGAHYGPWQGQHNVNPSDISMNGGNNMSPQQYASANQGLANNFMPSNSAVSDDELRSLDSNMDQQRLQQGVQQNQPQHFQLMNGYSNGFSQPMQHGNNQAHQLNGFSNTPDGLPIQSPFQHGFDFSQWQMQPTRQMSHQMSRSISGHGMQDQGSAMSPAMSPMAPSNNGLQIGHMQNGSVAQHGHQRNASGQWDSSLNSGYSQPFDSPLPSPANGAVHPQITEVLKSGTPASSPAARTNGKPTTTAEMKKAKRRASHNEVERRRRNHINDRITELADLVPKHRLEDEAIRRSVASNAAMPLSLSGGGLSPPSGSGLAGSQGRRAASISQGPLADDKDKGPAKGEVLDGAVSWTRDLLWMMNKMLAREQEMRHTISQLGGPTPRGYSDEEQRMLSEAKNAISHNITTIGQYSRRHGTELYVPGHTNHAGEPVAAPNQTSLSPSSVFDLDPVPPGTGNGSASNHFFSYLKEEDELLPEMEMN